MVTVDCTVNIYPMFQEPPDSAERLDLQARLETQDHRAHPDRRVHRVRLDHLDNLDLKVTLFPKLEIQMKCPTKHFTKRL